MDWPRPWNVEPYVRQEKLRILVYGLGPLGAEVVRMAAARPDIEIVGAVDPRPARAGQDAGEVAAVGRNLGVTVAYDPEAVLKDVYADVVFHTSEGSLTEVYPQLLQLLDSEKNVISACPELVYPWRRYPDIAKNLEHRARERGVRLLGAGGNPGLGLLSLPVALAASCQLIKSLRIERVMDVAKSDVDGQRRAGLGLTAQGCQQALAAGDIGYAGLEEVVFLLADTLGWPVERTASQAEPVLARERQRTDFFSIDKGGVAGLKQSASAFSSGHEVVRLDIEMLLHGQMERDSVRLEGKPPLEVNLPGGLASVRSAAAAIVNCLPVAANPRLPAGIMTLRDLPLVPYRKAAPKLREERMGA